MQLREALKDHVLEFLLKDFSLDNPVLDDFFFYFTNCFLLFFFINRGLFTSFIFCWLLTFINQARILRDRMIRNLLMILFLSLLLFLKWFFYLIIIFHDLVLHPIAFLFFLLLSKSRMSYNKKVPLYELLSLSLLHSLPSPCALLDLGLILLL